MMATKDTTRLPDPDRRAGSDVVIYDGECRICSRQIERLAGWDSGGRLSYLSLHDPRVADRYPDLTHEALMREMYVVDPAGGRHAGVSALRRLSRRLPSLWWLAPILHFPGTRPLWNWLYRQIASRRYRFGRIEACESGTCQLHH